MGRNRGYLTPAKTPRKGAYGRYSPYVRSGIIGAASMVGRAAYNAFTKKAAQAGKRTAKRVSRNLFGSKLSTPPGSRYVTTGSRRSRFKKPRYRVKYNRFNRYGSVKKVENGGLQNGSDCVYLGHSTSVHEQLVPAAVRAIVRELAKQAGFDFAQWDEIIPLGGANNWTYSLLYYASHKTGTQSSSSTSITAGTQTYLGLADAIYTQLKTTMQPGVELAEIRLNDHDGHCNAKVLLSQMDLTFEVVSVMKIQNRTLATSSITTAEHDEEMTQISNNPVVGKIYSGNHDGFMPDARGILPGGASFEGLLADTQQGVIAAKAADLPVGFKKPIDGQFLKSCYKTGNVIIMPGEIKTSRLKYTRRMNCLEFFTKLSTEIDEATVADTRLRTRFGVCEMVGVEKQLNSRDGEADISLAYEVSQIYKCSGYYKKSTKVMPLLEIN